MNESQAKERVGENVFDVKKWSASVLRTPREAEQKIAELLLEGRVIRNIVSVGNNYSWCVNNKYYSPFMVPVGGVDPVSIL